MDRKKALEFLSNEIPNNADVLHALKLVAVYLQQYEIAANLRDRELIQLKKLNDEINNKE